MIARLISGIDEFRLDERKEENVNSLRRNKKGILIPLLCNRLFLDSICKSSKRRLLQLCFVESIGFVESIVFCWINYRIWVYTIEPYPYPFATQLSTFRSDGLMMLPELEPIEIGPTFHKTFS